MSLNKYYKTLGLLPGADQAAIRKAFRKLAMRYHPDKNPSESAQAKFISITEAYEILTGKKPAPTTTTRASRSRAAANRKPTSPTTATNAEKENAERVREARLRQEEQAKREHLENERYYQWLTSGWRWKIIRISSVVGIILSVALIAERFLPDHYVEDKVKQVAVEAGFRAGNERMSIVETEANETYWISRMTYDLYGRHPRFYVRSSWFFHEPIELLSIGKVEYRPYKVHFTFYRNFWIFILLFLLPTGTIIFRDKTIYFTLMHQMSFYGVNALMLYFLLRNDHWAHFLTLGFF